MLYKNTKHGAILVREFKNRYTTRTKRASKTIEVMSYHVDIGTMNGSNGDSDDSKAVAVKKRTVVMVVIIRILVMIQMKIMILI